MKRTGLVPCYFSPRTLSASGLSAQLRKLARRLASEGTTAFHAPLVAAFASEIIQRKVDLPPWAPGGTTRYLVVLDVPDPVVPRLFSALDLRRPDQRVHATRDAGAVGRVTVSAARTEPMLGIVDAYLWAGTLTLVTGDFQFRSFPVSRIPVIAKLPAGEQGRFEIGADGAYLHWESGDVHLGVSQILQEADPMYLADVAIERNRQDATGAALRRIREEKGLRQADVGGVSERQVRRIEEGISRLRAETAETFAAAFGMELGALLDEVGRRAEQIRRASNAGRAGALPRPRRSRAGS